MIIRKVDVLGRIARADAWNIIAGFQNTKFVTGLLEERHQLGPKGRRNLAKQAEQIRYCLIQASEYFSAAEAVSIATRPLLLYYGIMSLAIAEFLFKQDGESSIDKARERHAHHGLDLRVKSDPSRAEKLSEALSALVAVPAVSTTRGRYGTFELWHRSAREWPISGVVDFAHPNGGGKTTVKVILEPSNTRLPLIPESGLSLRDCFSHLPWLSRAMSSRGIDGSYVRARIKKAVQANADSEVELIVQPSEMGALEKVYSRLLFHPSAVNCMTIKEFGNGGIFTIATAAGATSVPYIFPQAIQKKAGEVFLLADLESVNEFGNFYVGLFLLGNYARYYPDQWMRDVGSSSDLALVSSEFLDCAVERIPYLLASELLSTQLLID